MKILEVFIFRKNNRNIPYKDTDVVSRSLSECYEKTINECADLVKEKMVEDHGMKYLGVSFYNRGTKFDMEFLSYDTKDKTDILYKAEGSIRTVRSFEEMKITI